MKGYVCTLVALLVCIAGCDLGEHATAPALSEVPAVNLTEAGPPEFDVFVVAGQSNAQGRGDYLQSTTVPGGIAFESTREGLIPLLGDPVGDANTGSSWPAFAVSYHARTGRGVIIAEAARAASAMHPNAAGTAGNHWMPDESRYQDALAQSYRAMDQAQAAGMHARFAGWLWIQGEKDAQGIMLNSIVVQEYGLAFDYMLDTYGQDMIAWLGSDAPPLYMARTGRLRDADPVGFQLVRAAQDIVCNAHPYCHMASRSAASFGGPMYYVDQSHWSQFALEHIGKEMAKNIVAYQAQAETE